MASLADAMTRSIIQICCRQRWRTSGMSEGRPLPIPAMYESRHQILSFSSATSDSRPRQGWRIARGKHYSRRGRSADAGARDRRSFRGDPEEGRDVSCAISRRPARLLHTAQGGVRQNEAQADPPPEGHNTIALTNKSRADQAVILTLLHTENLLTTSTDPRPIASRLTFMPNCKAKGKSERKSSPRLSTGGESTVPHHFGRTLLRRTAWI